MTREITTRKLPIQRHSTRCEEQDDVVVEEPMEIQLDGTPFAVLMRTPGADVPLVTGFLITEGVIVDASDIAAISPCRDPHVEHGENVLLVKLAPGNTISGSAIERARRHLFASSSCGICGKATLDAVFLNTQPLHRFLEISEPTILGLGREANAVQPVFQRTGGCHAAIAFLCEPTLKIVAAAEDVGRHNAVDKVVGQLARRPSLEQPLVLWVSGRASFEMVQKALLGGFSALVCVGAPTTLAVDLAKRARLTLIGFAAGRRFNRYAWSETGA